MTSSAQPPHYILFSHSSISATAPAPSTSLGHPIIQYQYADDSPLSLLPQTPEEHVLVFDYDPAATVPPVVKSISKNMAVTALKIAEAPGAAAADEGDVKRNDRMYVVETTTSEDRTTETSQGEQKSAEAVLAKFKQRNAVIRDVLTYPDNSHNSKSSSPLPGSLPTSPLRLGFR